MIKIRDGNKLAGIKWSLRGIDGYPTTGLSYSSEKKSLENVIISPHHFAMLKWTNSV